MSAKCHERTFRGAPIELMRLVAFQLPAHAHAGFAADAFEVLAEGQVELGEHGGVGRHGLKKFAPAETSRPTRPRGRPEGYAAQERSFKAEGKAS
jgi:hypothetical protein